MVFHTLCFIILCVVLAVHATSWASTTPQIAGGKYYAIALKSDWRVRAWGGNSFGQLGDGTTTIGYLGGKTTPVLVSNLILKPAIPTTTTLASRPATLKGSVNANDASTTVWFE